MTRRNLTWRSALVALLACLGLAAAAPAIPAARGASPGGGRSAAEAGPAAPTWSARAPAAVRRAPVVPRIQGRTAADLRRVWARGLEAGNRPDVFSKAGDSITATMSFLSGIGCGEEELGERGDLRETIDHFRAHEFPSRFTDMWCGVANSFSRVSIAAESGVTSGWVLGAEDLRNRESSCEPPHFTYLRCELHLARPAMILIMFGTNDLAYEGDAAVYRRNLTEIVEEVKSYGVVPILSTIPPRADSATFARRVGRYNLQVVRVARARRVPLVNYWRAMTRRGMVNQGLAEDGIHPNLHGMCDPLCDGMNFSREALRYGFNQRNLTAIEAFREVKRAVIDA